MKDNESKMSKTRSARRPAIDLAIDKHNLAIEGNKVDKEFEQVAIDQMKTFLFAGDDTSTFDGINVFMKMGFNLRTHIPNVASDGIESDPGVPRGFFFAIAKF